MAAIQQGLCNVAVIAYGSTQRSVGRKQASVREINPYESPFKPFMPSTAYALAASRHMHQFGTTREQMAAVAVAAREWALLNPAAWEKKPLTIEAVLASRMVSYPFTVRDCCLVTDGGGAVIVTSAERARSLKKKPAYVLGCGQSTTHSSISSMPDLTVTGALAAGKAAYKMAKLGPADIDAVELYDAFTINTILFLEDLGFCKKGEGGAFVEGGRIGPKGSLRRQHQRRRPLLLPPRHVRPVPADRGGAPAARRMRRAPGQGLRGRPRPRQRRRAVDAGDGDIGDGRYGVGRSGRPHRGRSHGSGLAVDRALSVQHEENYRQLMRPQRITLFFASLVGDQFALVALSIAISLAQNIPRLPRFLATLCDTVGATCRIMPSHFHDQRTRAFELSARGSADRVHPHMLCVVVLYR